MLPEFWPATMSILIFSYENSYVLPLNWVESTQEAGSVDSQIHTNCHLRITDTVQHHITSSTPSSSSASSIIAAGQDRETEYSCRQTMGQSWLVTSLPVSWLATLLPVPYIHKWQSSTSHTHCLSTDLTAAPSRYRHQRQQATAAGNLLTHITIIVSYRQPVPHS